MSLTNLLNTTCSVYGKTESVDSTSKETVETFPLSATYTLVKCALQFSSGRNSGSYQREGHAQGGSLFIQHADRTKIAHGCRVTVASTGLTYSVTSNAQDDSGRGAYARYSVDLYTGGGPR